MMPLLLKALTIVGVFWLLSSILCALLVAWLMYKHRERE